MTSRTLAHVVVGLRPVPWPRTRGGAPGTPRVNPAAYRDWKNTAAELIALAARGKTTEGPVAVFVTVHPDGLTIKVKDAQDTRTGLAGDLDNYAKAVLDAVQASGVIKDDRQVHLLAAGFTPLPAHGSRILARADDWRSQ